MREAIATNRGHVFKTVGDSFCAAFSQPESAALAALDAQRALGRADFSAADGLRVRMAIHTGTADERDGDYFGPTLNRVARLLALGHGGQVLLSRVAAELVRENLPAGATLADLGEHVLKDHEGAERVYQLVAPDLQREFPEVRSPRALQPWLVPETMLTRYFTGRDDLLARLREATAGAASSCVERARRRRQDSDRHRVRHAQSLRVSQRRLLGQRGDDRWTHERLRRDRQDSTAAGRRFERYRSSRSSGNGVARSHRWVAPDSR